MGTLFSSSSNTDNRAVPESPEPPAKDAADKVTQEFYVCFQGGPLELHVQMKRLRELGVVATPCDDFSGHNCMCRVVSTTAWLKRHQMETQMLLFFIPVDYTLKASPVLMTMGSNARPRHSIADEKWGTQRRPLPPPELGTELYPNSGFTEAGRRAWTSFVGDAAFLRLSAKGTNKGEWLVFHQDGLPKYIVDIDKVIYKVDLMDSTSVFFRDPCMCFQLELVMDKADPTVHMRQWDDGWTGIYDYGVCVEHLTDRDDITQVARGRCMW